MADDAMQEYDDDQRAAICYSQYRERAFSVEGKGMAQYRDKLHELMRKRALLRQKLDPFLKSDAERPDGEPMPKQDSDAFDAIMAELQELEDRIARCEQAIDAAQPDDEEENAADGDGDDDRDDRHGDGDEDEDQDGKGYRMPPNRGPGLSGRVQENTYRGAVLRHGGGRVYPRARHAPVRGKGFQAARFLIGIVHSKWYGAEKAGEFIQNRFHDDDVAKYFLSKALNYTVVAEGGALIPQDFSPELIELLRANVVVRGATPITVQMTMGNLTLPRLAGGSTAVYQGELDDISVTEEQFDDLNLIAKKLTAMVPISNDLIRRSPLGVETIVRDDLIQGIARKEDVTFLRGDGTNKGPIGFRSLVLAANLLTIPVGGDLDAVVAALASMKLLLVNGMSRMIRPAWFFAPTLVEFIATRRDSVGGFYYKDEISRGTLLGYPIFTSQQIPTNLGTGNGSEFYLADMADVVIGDTLNVMVDASDVAAYYGTDGKVVSTFQRDQSLFRVITEHDFNMRHLQSLAVGVTSDWLFTGLPGVPGAPFSTQPLNPHWAQAPAAWPANVTHDPAPTIYDPAVVQTSAFAGTLTSNPGGGPYPLVGSAPAGESGPGGAPPAAGEGGAPPPPPPAGNGGRGRSGAAATRT